MRFTVIAPALTGLLIGVVAPVPAQQPVGEFYFFERSDRSTGEDRSSITTVAEEGYVSGAGGLTVHCADEGLELVVSASYLGRDMSIPEPSPHRHGGGRASRRHAGIPGPGRAGELRRVRPQRLPDAPAHVHVSPRRTGLGPEPVVLPLSGTKPRTSIERSLGPGTDSRGRLTGASFCSPIHASLR